MSLTTDAEWKQALKKPFMKGVSDTGIGAKLRDFEKAKDNAGKKKALDGLLTVIKKNVKDYKDPKYKQAQVYFADLIRDAEEEGRAVDAAEKKIKAAGVESVLKDKATRAKFKTWLGEKGKKSLVAAVELWEICKKPPTDDDKIREVCLKYRDVDIANLGIWQQMQDANNWKNVIQEIVKQLTPFIQPFMTANVAT